MIAVLAAENATSPLAAYLPVVLTSVLGLVGAYLTFRVGKGANGINSSQQMIDQLQQEVGRHSGRIHNLETRLNTRDDYISALRRHIEDQLPPPPPPWPAEPSIGTT